MARATHSTEKIGEALSLLNEAAADKKQELTNMLAGKYDDLKGAVLGAESEAEERARRGLDRVREAGREANETIRHTAERVDRRVHDDPWKTLGLSVAGAFVLGFLFGRKNDGG